MSPLVVIDSDDLAAAVALSHAEGLEPGAALRLSIAARGWYSVLPTTQLCRRCHGAYLAAGLSALEHPDELTVTAICQSCRPHLQRVVP